FCVTAPANRAANVDYGTSLTFPEDIRAGVETHQVYYSLMQQVIPPGETVLVWAVCGGDGDMVRPGSKMIIGHHVPALMSRKIAEHVEEMKAIDRKRTGMQVVLASLPTSNTDARDTVAREIKLLDESLGEQAPLLRAAAIRENHKNLVNGGFTPIFY